MPNSDPVHIENTEPRAPESARRSQSRRRGPRRKRGRTARIRRRREGRPLRYENTDEVTVKDLKVGNILYERRNEPVYGDEYIIKYKVVRTIGKDGKLLRASLKFLEEFTKNGEKRDSDDIGLIVELKAPFEYAIESAYSKLFKSLDEAVRYDFKPHAERLEAEEERQRLYND